MHTDVGLLGVTLAKRYRLRGCDSCRSSLVQNLALSGKKQN